MKPCDVPGNSISYFNVASGMISKVDYAINADFNISRAVPDIVQIILKITKCRESISSNTCELFQTWHFDKSACKAYSDPKAPWHAINNQIKPPAGCPMKKGTYRMQNVTIPTKLLDAIPLPWEGNVWLVRIDMMDTKTSHHLCSDMELHAHRVRD